ncbi:MAG: histone deacetylase family protein [Candidatus Lokiarchaeota archaeon]|nr:histone deacetylase family protein [Candidatus Lokiarchaeota archaeon]
MKIVFHDNFYGSYTSDPAASEGRLEPIIKELKKYPDYEFIEPQRATDENILLAHTPEHVVSIKDDRFNTKIYEMAILAAGGAIKCADLAYNGTPCFGVIRPPGHHASANSCWGFCYFNNISVSLLYLVKKYKIKSAFVLDFDLHTGDGNINILNEKKDLIRTQILNPASDQEDDYLDEIAKTFKQAGKFDIIVASAGFDEYVKDWGHKLSTDAYRIIGRLMRDFSKEKTEGKRYALLEGGYYHADLGLNVHAFCEGFE